MVPPPPRPPPPPPRDEVPSPSRRSPGEGTARGAHPGPRKHQNHTQSCDDNEVIQYGLILTGATYCDGPAARRNTWEGPNPPPTAYPRGQPISDAERNFSLISQLMSPPGGEGHRIAGGGGGGEEKAGRELARGPERQDGAPRGVLRRACAPRLPGTAGARGFSVSPGSCRCLSVRVDHQR